MDQYHLREVLSRWRDKIRGNGQDPAKVHWQSVTVLLCQSQNIGHLEWLATEGTHSGWFRDGLKTTGEDTSLYLSPKGMPYFCGYSGHYGLYGDLMCLGQSAMNDAGWLHISDGRVDIEARMTEAQSRWLEDNKPGKSADWLLNVISDKTPIPYPAADKFDVRPSRDEDYIPRLMTRIERASSGASL